MNPRDIMTDAIHNFHPQYQQYTQYSSDNRRFQATNPNHSATGDHGLQTTHQPQQHSNGVLLKASQKDLESGNRRKHDESMGESCAEDSVTTATQAAKAVATTAASVASNAATAASTGIKSAVQPRQAKVTNTEKTLLLSSDDEFQ